METKPILSMIIPTRKRIDKLCTLLDSLVRHTRDLRRLEVVLVVDADDKDSQTIRFRSCSLQRVVLQPGLTMGALNVAGYEAASGDFLMLLNDDVIIRTPAWDRQVLCACRRFADGIVLVHVNDTLFGEGMCTFPIVSRTFCELAGGICPIEYQRYRIDDHIESIFHLLGALDEQRIVYLPDVVFEHGKYTETGQKAYFLDPSIEALDGPRYEQAFCQRKQIAVRLKRHIAARQGVLWQDEGRLETVEESSLERTRAIVRGPVLQRLRACYQKKGIRALARSASKVLFRQRRLE